MRWFKADLHIHSVLSPCGGLEMSPREVVARAKSCGIDWMAITDHNSLANCPAYSAVAEREGLAFTWGVEMQTAEEIHLLVYFDDPAAAKSFGGELYASLLPLDNDPEFFGDQVIIDENENILGMELRALMNSSIWDLSTAVEVARNHGGYCVPAHVDATVNSLIGQLGFLPEEPHFELLGLSAKADLARLLSSHPELAGKSWLRSSDAHYLADMGSGFSRVLAGAPKVEELVKAALGLDDRMILV
ncbi:MAG TPA: PHP domain-containing protein [Candidatus Syntrophosphaera sp.]|nr:PHP domain-containing protein [Candidatus Syntrophosphaera sp.]HPK83539.1 PHP domain-containing protein [Candidatus Syntrophosphaera sp.]HRQ68122.1 PHP domain-containing protein [Candidatus Syntrophosphaera sp.]HRT59836.1 PHP domain-containing protein [Candidatus Syntrophosphaera sp.]